MWFLWQSILARIICSIIHLVIFGLNILKITKSPSLHQLLGIIVFTSLTVSYFMTMIVNVIVMWCDVNVVCTTFIEVITSSKTYGVDSLVEKYTQLVEKYEKIKAGFSPYLLIHLPVLTMFFLPLAFIIFLSISTGSFINVGSVGLKGVFAKNERGYRLNAIKKRFWSPLILLLSVASIRRKLIKTSHTEERRSHTNWGS